MTFENFSPASERNKDSIWRVLSQHLGTVNRLLEVGSGSGQHAIHFSQALRAQRQEEPIVWQPTELRSNIPALKNNLVRHKAHCAEPYELDVSLPLSYQRLVDKAGFDGFFTANTLHIMNLEQVAHVFELLHWALTAQGHVFIYGPFKYAGEFTSESNAAFDLWLKARNPASGIRDVEHISDLASLAGLRLHNDYTLPANNQCLHFVRD